MKSGIILAMATCLMACDGAPPLVRPTPSTPASPAPAAGSIATSATISWDCFVNTGFGRTAGCPGPRVAAATRSLTAALPGPSSSLSVSVSGSSVTLAWTASTGATSYVLEAGSGPGRSDITVFDTGSAATTLAVLNVPAGTYYTRVRGRNSEGVGSASADAIVIVDSLDAACPPVAPQGLSSIVTGSTVVLSWNPSGGVCAPTSYSIEAGSASGLANLANFNTGSTATSFTATGVATGTYFVRTRAVNGRGPSAPSNEIIVAVGTTACSYALNPTFQSASSAGGSFTSSLSAGCAWSATSDQPWLTLASSSGVGSASIAYSVAANVGGASRTGRVTITGPGGTVQLTVTQAATTCSYSLAENTLQVAAAGGSGTVALTASCAWTVSSDQSWLTITSPTSGTTSATISFSAAANGGGQRTGTITVTGSGGTVQLAVTQAAAACSYTLAPTTQTAPAGGGTFTITVTASCAWSAASNVSWLNTTSTGTGNGTITYAVAPNSGAARSGSIIVTGPGGTAASTVNQDGASVTLTTIGIVGSFGSQAFSPNPASVQSGGMVKWHNSDGTVHRIVLDDFSYDSGNLTPGADSPSLSVGAASATYHCTIHPSMVGTISRSP